MRLTSTSTPAEAVAAAAATVAQLVASNLNFIIVFPSSCCRSPFACSLMPSLSQLRAPEWQCRAQVYVHTHTDTHTRLYRGCFPHPSCWVCSVHRPSQRHTYTQTLVLHDVVLFIILKAKAASCLPSFRFGRWASAERWQRASRSSEIKKKTKKSKTQTSWTSESNSVCKYCKKNTTKYTKNIHTKDQAEGANLKNLTVNKYSAVHHSCTNRKTKSADKLDTIRQRLNMVYFVRICDRSIRFYIWYI